jgi:DNA-binding response OmpR family regulator
MSKPDLTPELLAKLAVLLVDGDRFTRGVVASILRQMGVASVSLADGCAQAAALLREVRIDVVVTERELPDGDGLALTRWIRTHAQSPTPKVPVIMVTGRVQQSDVIAAREAGVTEFIAKPISEQALRLRLRAVLLDPREFVRAESFVGPSRRRGARGGYKGTERRGRGG